MVFDFLRKKLQEAVAPAAAQPITAAPGSEADYEERRKTAEALEAEGKRTEAVALLEALAADLAGAGNFPLAVAVRHQIHRWRPEGESGETPIAEGKKMAHQRAQTGAFAPKAADAPVNKILEASPLLSELTAEEIAGLMESTGLTTYAKDQTVVQEGAPGDHLYIVTRGLLNVTISGAGGGRVRLGVLSVGDFFGEVALLTGKPRAATVEADTDAECLQITAQSWQDLAAKHPRLQKLLEEAIAQRAQNAADAVLEDFRKRRDEAP